MERTPLSLLSETLLADAIEEYVDKRTTEVIADAVGRSLRDAQKELKADEQVREQGASLTPDTVIQLAKKRHDEMRAQQLALKPIRAKREGERDALEGIDARQLRAIGIKQQSDDDDEEEEKRPRGRAVGRGKPAAANRGRGRGAAAGGASRARGGRQRSKVERDSDDDEKRSHGDRSAGQDDFGGDVDDGEMEWGESDDEMKQPASRRRQPAVGQARGQRGGRLAQRDEMDDNEEQDEVDEESPAPKRSRVKAEPASRVPVGRRNQGGELNFLAQAAGGGGRGRAGNRAAPRGRAAGGRAEAQARDDVVDLIED